jgi:hypothetical protein
MAQNFFNAATQVTTVFAPDGAELTTTRLNALELIRYSGYTWSSPLAAPATETAVVALATVEASTAPVTTPVAEVPPVLVPEAAPVDPIAALDHTKAPLTEIAFLLTGTNDVAKYLAGFSPEGLRTLADERYGQRIHRNMSKENVIDKILVLEGEKTTKESTPV